MDLDRYLRVRKKTEEIVSWLETEDFIAQSADYVSPPRWHLAHVTWFFEVFILEKVFANYKLFSPDFPLLFNSYYKTKGRHWLQSERGQLSRPTVAEVHSYRKYVDEHMAKLIALESENTNNELDVLFEIGLNHEQQHQELLYMDILHNFAVHPQVIPYREAATKKLLACPEHKWLSVDGGLVDIGYGGEAFFYDNEKPVHKAYLRPYQIANRMVSETEYLAFMKAGGYEEADLWLSDGWNWIHAENISAPHYWEEVEGEWQRRTLNGSRPLSPDRPVAHLSFFEAEAYARWKDARLPTEQEWEAASHFFKTSERGLFCETARFDAEYFCEDKGLWDMHGMLWQWTQSAYLPYPGYKRARGALGEYNGKFMNGQRVLRGGCLATSESHYRKTYRNFFQADQRWMFSGLRLARDL